MQLPTFATKGPFFSEFARACCQAGSAHSMPGKLPDLNNSFANHALGLFAKHCCWLSGLGTERFLHFPLTIEAHLSRQGQSHYGHGQSKQ